ncbi:MAG: hypothetical protein ACYTFY_08355 [Planctomycetota bacterium]|jgi:hypothetical protein
MENQNKTYKILSYFAAAFVFIIIASVAAVFLADRFLPSNARGRLPDSATEIKEYYWGAWSADFTRALKARIPQEDFVKYANSLGFVKYEKDRHGKFPNDGPADLTWWDLPENTTDCYIDPESNKHYQSWVKYADGYVYFYAVAW